MKGIYLILFLFHPTAFYHFSSPHTISFPLHLDQKYLNSLVAKCTFQGYEPNLKRILGTYHQDSILRTLLGMTHFPWFFSNSDEIHLWPWPTIYELCVGLCYSKFQCLISPSVKVFDHVCCISSLQLLLQITTHLVAYNNTNSLSHSLVG